MTFVKLTQQNDSLTQLFKAVRATCTKILVQTIYFINFSSVAFLQFLMSRKSICTTTNRGCFLTKTFLFISYQKLLTRWVLQILERKKSYGYQFSFLNNEHDDGRQRTRKFFVRRDRYPYTCKRSSVTQTFAIAFEYNIINQDSKQI